MTDSITVERAELDGRVWTARVRYKHKFEDEPVEEVDASHIAQGATARMRGGRVETVDVPDGQLRTQNDVEDIARAVTRDLETTHE